MITDEALRTIEPDVATPTRRKRRKTYAVSLAKTAELPDLSSLTLESAEPAPVIDRRQGQRSEVLDKLPPSIQLPPVSPFQGKHEWLCDWESWAVSPPQQELLLRYLPALYEILSEWEQPSEDVSAPFALAELFQNLSAPDILELSAAALPHAHQVNYLRHAALCFHLKLLQLPLTDLLQTLRRCFGEERAHVQRILPALGYYVSCASYSFYGIQTQALKRLSTKTGYLYPLILEEWAKNQRIRQFMLSWMPRKEKHAARLLASEDWEFVFYVLNNNWAQSVMRDVYGVFHGSSAFGTQIVDAEAARGFGDLTASAGKSFLATRQIADLLRKDVATSPQQQTQQFQQFVEDRYRKDVLRKEVRPNLNAPTLKRIERFVQTVFQRGEQNQQSLHQVCERIGSEVFRSFSYLTPERFRWLGYELTRMCLRLGAPAGSTETTLAELLGGLVHAIVSESAQSLKQRSNTNHMLGALLATTLQAALDDALFLERDARWISQLPHQLGDFVEQAADRVLAPFYVDVLEQHLSEEPVL